MTIPNLISMAVPVFFLLIGVEMAIGIFLRRRNYRFNDSINDLSLGIADQVLGAFLKSFVFAGYLWLYQNHRWFEIPKTATTMWVACFLMYDFMYYWAHRASHEINLAWASHIPHHQSEEYNLTVALRQGAFQGCIFWVFYLPLAVVGFSPLMFLICAQVDTLYQFWIHTRTIGKLGPVEWIMNTPSHHRVHHAKNPKYIDKNHGGVLIIWDRLFGTFKEEEEEPIYGTATPLNSWNPVWANIHYWIDLACLSWHAPRWRDKFLVWFMKPAWRPEGLERTGRPAYLTRAFYQKYDPKVPVGLSWYVFLEFIPTIVLGTLLVRSELGLESLQRFIIAAFIIVSLVILGGLLEGKRWAFILELLRIAVAATAVVMLDRAYLGFESTTGKVAAVIGATGALLLAFWLMRYRRRFTRPMGKLPFTEDIALDIETSRRKIVQEEILEKPSYTDGFEAVGK